MDLTINKTLLWCILINFTKLTSSSLGIKENKIAYVFKTFLDLNKDGKLDAKDYDQIAFHAMKVKQFKINGIEHTTVQEYVQSILNGMLEQAGAKDVGFIKLEQYKRIWDDYSANSTTVPNWQHNSANLYFRWIDDNGDGFITRSEFVSFMSSYGTSTADAGFSFDKLSEGGPVDKYRFLELWKQYFTSDDPLAPGNFLAGRINFDSK